MKEIQLDGEKLFYFNTLRFLNGEIIYQFAKDLSIGFPTHEVKDYQISELIKENRFKKINQ